MATDIPESTAAPDQRPEWQALQAHASAMADATIRGLFDADPGRYAGFHVHIPGMLYDYSKNLIDDETRSLLMSLARACDLEKWRDAMFAGAPVNDSENRAVLHTAMRRPEGDEVYVTGENVMPFVHGELEKMRSFSEEVRAGTWKGHSGKAITDVVNIGIGGSDLGPQMVYRALRPLDRSGPRHHFVANIDGNAIAATLSDLNPESTLFIIASKTFTTQETLANAQTARKWTLRHYGNDECVARHFVAVSTNEAAVKEFGILPGNMFCFRDWVGGRYSLWSSIGLPLCTAFGFPVFRALLDGAHAMDRHFKTAALEQNIPVLAAMIGIWYRNFLNYPAYAVIPYADNLDRLPAWLQQLDMESNGKRIDRNGDHVSYATGPVIFGEPGTNAQHAFFQHLHQGSDIIPCDFLGAVDPGHGLDSHHRKLMANMLAQSRALMAGRGIEDSPTPQQSFPGNRPSSVILADKMDAWHMGQILALYEHKVFVQGIIWNLNSFDQPGVELGKHLAKDILSSWGGKPAAGWDSSTQNLYTRIADLS